MATWPRHIDQFERKHDKVFTVNPFSGVDLFRHIRKPVQVFLHSCNITCLNNVDIRELLEFGKLRQIIERGGWITSSPVWMELPMAKVDWGSKLEIGGGGGPGQTQCRAEAREKREANSQLKFMEKFG